MHTYTSIHIDTDQEHITGLSHAVGEPCSKESKAHVEEKSDHLCPIPAVDMGPSMDGSSAIPVAKLGLVRGHRGAVVGKTEVAFV